MIPQDFWKQVLDALMQVLYTILKIILLPFNLWVKSITNLAKHKESGLLDLHKIGGLWPYFTFCKRLIMDVLLDVIAFLSYPIGIFSAFVGFVVVCVNAGHYASFGMILLQATGSFIGILFFSYLTPVYTACINNTLQFLLLPLRKLIDWCKKPAQHVDINLEKKEENK
jgi:hypothetical protein